MDDAVVTRLRLLLQEIDMETTTEKQLRKRLEQELNTDLSGHKNLIRSEIELYLNNQQQHDDAEVKEEVTEEAMKEEEGEEEEEEEDNKVGKKRKGRGFGSSMLSEPLAKFMGTDRAPRNEVVKRIWEYIRAHDLQNPKDRRKIMPDEVLGTILTAPVNMMTMNTQLNKHCFSKDRFDAEEDEDEQDSSEEPKAKVRAKKSKLSSNGEEREKKPRAPGKPVRTTDEMAEWIGGQQIMSRPQITSFFWTYIKSENLLNPANKREVICNDVLRNLTGKDKFLAFGGQKHFGHHILK